MVTVLLIMLALAAVLLMLQFGLDTQNPPKQPADLLTEESYVLAMVVIAGLATAVLLYVAPQNYRDGRTA